MDNFIELQNTSVLKNKYEWNEQLPEMIKANTLHIINELQEQTAINKLNLAKSIPNDLNLNKIKKNNQVRDFLIEKLTDTKKTIDEDKLLF